MIIVQGGVVLQRKEMFHINRANCESLMIGQDANGEIGIILTTATDKKMLILSNPDDDD